MCIDFYEEKNKFIRNRAYDVSQESQILKVYWIRKIGEAKRLRRGEREWDWSENCRMRVVESDDIGRETGQGE